MTHAQIALPTQQTGLLGLYQELHRTMRNQADMAERRRFISMQLLDIIGPIEAGAKVPLSPDVRLAVGDLTIIEAALKGRIREAVDEYERKRTAIRAAIAPLVGSSILVRSADQANPNIRLGVERDAPVTAGVIGILQPYASEDIMQLRLSSVPSRFQHDSSAQLWVPVIDSETGEATITLEFQR